MDTHREDSQFIIVYKDWIHVGLVNFEVIKERIEAKTVSTSYNSGGCLRSFGQPVLKVVAKSLVLIVVNGFGWTSGLFKQAAALQLDIGQLRIERCSTTN